MIDPGIKITGTPRGNLPLGSVATLISVLVGLASHGPVDTITTTTPPVAPATKRPMGTLR